ncbi:MAG: hypothetical protein IID30_07015 [Planctomycetes bacterium]|nr:hypothetical protein [Planctomycetota bacterium]
MTMRSEATLSGRLMAHRQNTSIPGPGCQWACGEQVPRPNVSTSAGSGEIIRFIILSKLRLTFLYDPPFSALQVPLKFGFLDIVTSSFVNSAHCRGIDVHPWTINDPAEMRRLIAIGVDGIFTDYPDRLKQVLAGEPPDTPTS